MSAVVFADILGVATATECLNDSAEVPTYDDSSWVRRLELFRSYPEGAAQDKALTGFDLWLRALVTLPVLVAESLVLLREIDGKAHVHCALFSDSVFVVLDEPEHAVHLASYLLAGAFQRVVPLRLGLGLGSFARFSTDDLQELAASLPPQASDKPGPGGFTKAGAATREAEMWEFVRAHLRVPGPDLFLGGAVTRAFRAESCGLKGMRAFVHDSLVEGLPDAQRVYLRAIPGWELRHRRANAHYVRFEVCWPLSLVHWKDRSVTARPSVPVPFAGYRFKSNLADAIVYALEYPYDPLHVAQVQYRVTWAALVGLRDHMEKNGFSRNIPADPRSKEPAGEDDSA